MDNLEVKEVDFIDLSDFVERGSNYLTLSRDTPDDVLASIARKLQLLEGVLAWYIGDYLLGLESLRGETRANELIKAWGIGERSAYEAKQICSLFAPEDREPLLTFSHHKVVAEECDTYKEQLHWLAEATPGARNLSVAKLRAAIRIANKNGPTLPPSTRNLQPLSSFIQFATRTAPESLSPADRETLKDNAPLMIEWWQKIANS